MADDSVIAVCPYCKKEPATVSSCPRRLSQCETGHQWHTCCLHNVVVKGLPDDTAKPDTCTCVSDRSEFDVPEWKSKKTPGRRPVVEGDEKKSGRGLYMTARRRAEIFRMKVEGKSDREIAKFFGTGLRIIAQTIAYEIRKMNKRAKEDLAHHIRLQCERLDRLLAGLTEKGFKGDVGAVDRILKILERQADLLGLDAPKRSIQHVINVDELSDEQLVDMARQSGLPVPTRLLTTDVVDAEVVEKEGVSDDAGNLDVGRESGNVGGIPGQRQDADPGRKDRRVRDPLPDPEKEPSQKPEEQGQP